MPTELTPAWLAAQFRTAAQLRGYLALSREERVACFPGHDLEQLDDNQWLQIGRSALAMLDTLRGSN